LDIILISDFRTAWLQ